MPLCIHLLASGIHYLPTISSSITSPVVPGQGVQGGETACISGSLPLRPEDFFDYWSATAAQERTAPLGQPPHLRWSVWFHRISRAFSKSQVLHSINLRGTKWSLSLKAHVKKVEEEVKVGQRQLDPVSSLHSMCKTVCISDHIASKNRRKIFHFGHNFTALIKNFQYVWLNVEKHVLVIRF